MTNHVQLLLPPEQAERVPQVPISVGRRGAYRDLFRRALDEKPLTDLRLALNQYQPIGNHRFCREVEAMTGHRWALRKRSRPRKRDETTSASDAGLLELPL